MLVVSETDTYNYTRIYEEILTKAGKKHITFLHDRNRNHKSLFYALMNKQTCDTRDRTFLIILPDLNVAQNFDGLKKDKLLETQNHHGSMCGGHEIIHNPGPLYGAHGAACPTVPLPP